MALKACQAVALFNIFLMLSMHPVGALRAKESDALLARAEEVQSVVSQLQAALDEDSKQDAAEEEEYIGEFFASCARRKVDFERRAQKVKERYDQAKEDGALDQFEAAYVILKVRELAKTMERAQQRGCDWSEFKKADTGPLMDVVHEVAATDPCFSKVRDYLESVPKLEPEAQGAAMGKALGMLVSQDCTVVEPSGKAETSREFETEVDEGLEELNEAVIVEARKQIKKGTGSSALLQGGLQKYGIVASGTGANPLLEVFVKIFGFLVLILAWALVCFIIGGFLLGVLGLILCTLKILIVALIRVFHRDFWDLNFGGCMLYWISSFGLGSANADATAIAICAASVLTKAI